MSISIETFGLLEIRIGRILEVDDIPQARKPIYKLRIDFGPFGIKQCAGGVKPYYSKERLVGKESRGDN